MTGRGKYRAAVAGQVAARRARRASPDYSKAFVYRTPTLGAGDVDFGDWFWECVACWRVPGREFIGHSRFRSNVVWDLTEHFELFHRQESE